ncbi:cob(I)yrinic acid a,c-diamide adenosyltransferase [Halorhabdus sp. CBA1104]|uniref:cob(I)yrinic acid a,c-diamide adenosyltransferase n=1 Tax=unclassified Halorhabdus TaxID=2621901 RepID=UPI0012B29AA0|nr:MULTISPECIES: cob(I)yrinic acid a,c-diamide adenosyltransferase [unclassified Halorhabdus]QGN07284.1 cob(I)yrinic acid a,c-diamide adenosyltransferase [Halorhabdus sp. CBA1104]
MTRDTTEDEASTTDEPTAPSDQDAVPDTEPIEPATPEAFGLVQAWWGDGKGKTTAALGMGLRAAGHGYRVHVLQFMKGGTPSVEGVRGEFNAIAQVPGYTIENTGHVGWHGFMDDTDDDEHAARARAALARAREIVAATAERDPTTSLDADGAQTTAFALDGEPTAGVHMLILDEVLYAANRGLIDPDDVLDLIDDTPEDLELVLTGGHEYPAYLEGAADLLSHVEKQAHPLEAGQPARKGTEY